MKKKLMYSNMLIVLLSLSTVLAGQYTGTNPDVALLKLATAPDSIIGFEPSKAVDNSASTYAAIPGNAPTWISIDLGAYFLIDGYAIDLPRNGELPTEYIFQASEDADVWLDINSVSVSGSGTFSYDVVSPGPIRYVRIYMTDKNTLASFAQISVFGELLMRPVSPVSTAATNITSSSFRANWNSSLNADGYVLSVATDLSFTNLVPGYDNKWVNRRLFLDIPDLAPGTAYYYRLRAYNLAGSSSFGNVITVNTTKGEQTITFEAIDTLTYGDATFEPVVSTSSGLTVILSSSDESVATVDGTSISLMGVGNSTITATQPGNDQYNPAEPVSIELIVNAKAIYVSGAKAENKIYDGTNEAQISGAVLDGVVDGDDVTLVNADSGQFSTVNTGTGITIATSMDIVGADTAKYIFSDTLNLTADITPAVLIVFADDKSREECASNPEFTVTYDGFIESEDKSVLDSEPGLDCSADENSKNGTYDILVSGGSAANYSFIYENGILTVTPDITVPVLVVKDFTIQLDENNRAEISPADVVESAHDNCSIVDTLLSQSVFSDADIGEVSVDVTVTDPSGNNSTSKAIVTVLGNTGAKLVAEVKTKVFPNPTNGMIYLEMNRTAEDLRVMDITGKTIINLSDLKAKQMIDLSEFQSGIYVIHLNFGSDSEYHKIMKK